MSQDEGGLAALAAIAHALRLSGWRGLRTLSEPIVWVLHIAYAWLPIGLALKALSLLLAQSWAAHWPHAFTMGVFGMMILAVMTRASLGHTGRPLVAPPWIAVSYVLVATAVAVRVLVPAAGLLDYRATMILAGTLWTIAFGIFVAIYAPILTTPRLDGKPG